MQDKPIYIYLDDRQCDNFDVSYFGDSTLVVAADTLVRSKWGGYDRWHKTILESFGGSTITLTKTGTDRPGWYLLTGYSESDFPELHNENA